MVPAAPLEATITPASRCQSPARPAAVGRPPPPRPRASGWPWRRRSRRPMPAARRASCPWAACPRAGRRGSASGTRPRRRAYGDRRTPGRRAQAPKSRARCAPLFARFPAESEPWSVDTSSPHGAYRGRGRVPRPGCRGRGVAAGVSSRGRGSLSNGCHPCPDSRRADPLGSALTCGFSSGGGRI